MGCRTPRITATPASFFPGTANGTAVSCSGRSLFGRMPASAAPSGRDASSAFRFATASGFSATIAVARAHLDARAVHTDFDPAELAVLAHVRGLVAEQVVRRVLDEDRVHGRSEVVGVHPRVSAGGGRDIDEVVHLEPGHALSDWARATRKPHASMVYTLMFARAADSNVSDIM